MPDVAMGRSIRSVLTDDVLAKMGLEMEQARGLPNAAFVDEAFYELEQKYLFARTWVFAGRASQLPDAGDVRPVTVAGQPVILVRGRDGIVRGFHNVCPHRGARLVTEGADGLAMMSCPYHAWTYALDGKLKSRPHFHKPDCHDTQGDDNVSLFEVRTETWHDWIFVNLDGGAESFEGHIAPVEAWFSGIRLGELTCAHHETWEFDCNWKLAFENYCDFYHVFLVHPALNQSMTKDARKSMLTMGRHLMNEYWFEEAGRGGAGDKSGLGMSLVPGITPEGQNRAAYTAMFPNTALNVYPSNAQFVQFEPLGAGRTRMHMWFYFVPEDVGNPAFKETRDNLYREWDLLNREDEDICRRLQEGRLCDAYDGGRLAPYWDQGTVHFHKQIAEVMTA